jgi:hypothetical protein
MAELTVLDEKLAEVLGLAQAGQAATKKVLALARKEKDQELVALLDQMGKEAATTEERARKVADKREGLKTAINKKARETKAEVSDFMKTYLEGAEALDGLEFLSMAEAGEMAHVEILGTLGEKAGDSQVRKLVEFAAPVQRRHVDSVREHALRLAGEEDPAEAA